MKDFFDEIIKKTLQYEGGYSNDSDDAGGETKYGISQRQYPNVDISNLTLQDALKIYKEDYYDRHNLSRINSKKIQWKVFDINVNAGRGVKFLQRAVGVKEDGIIGDVTAKAVNEKNEVQVLMSLREIQENFYKEIVRRKPSQKKFLKGWLRRAFDIGEGL